MEVARKQVNALKLSDSQVCASLDLGNQQVIDTLLQSRRLLTAGLSNQTQLLIQSDRAEHLETRATILAATKYKNDEALNIHLLHSLKFPAMNERRDEICEAYHKTFRWVFRDPLLSGKPWSNFAHWLQRGSGIYWINGKAGSGKSTLMRKIVESPKTLESIKIWSEGVPTKIISFFFWNSGTALQRSQVGLFRSLLYDALEDQTDLVPSIFPHELESALSDIARGQNVLSVEWNWSLNKLQQAFARLTKYATTSLKFCFFLDGLDEYEGDHENLAKFFTSLSSMSHVKLCVSSRPWLIFEESFRGIPGLRLQDLTFDDIVAYVGDMLQDDRKMLYLANKNPSHASELVNEIVTKANGVFLWVTLVVRSLLKGLRNGDDVADLSRRLKDLPADLGPFYKHMMDQIEPLYRQQAAQIFQTYRAMMVVQGLDAIIDPLELNLAVTAYPFEDLYRSWNPMELDEYQSRREQMDVHLKSRCAGLLETTEHKLAARTNRSSFKVAYLHRTVRDFLDTEDVRAVLLSDTASVPNFEPNAWVLMSYITRLRRSVFLAYGGPYNDTANIAELHNYNMWRTGHLALKYAASAAKCGDRTYEGMLDVLDQTINRQWQGRDDDWQNGDHLIRGDQLAEWNKYLLPRGWQNSLLTKATTLGMCSYTERILRWNITLPASKPGRPLLDYCLIPRYLDGHISIDMVTLLLNYGANVNQNWNGSTPWRNVLAWVHAHNWDRPDPLGRTPYFTLTSWANILKLLFQYGANPFASCAQVHGGGPNPKYRSHHFEDVITDVFQKRLPHEATELLHIQQQKKRAHGNLHKTQVSLRDNDKSNKAKRKYSGSEEQEARKRKLNPCLRQYNTPRPRGDRYLDSAPRGSGYGSQSTWRFAK
jgi:hypothetical protein